VSVVNKMTHNIIETTFHVRYAETDQMGIVHHSTYVIWMEEGRSDFMRQKQVDYADVEKRGLALAVTELNVRYIAPAHYGEQVTVRTWVASLRSRMLVFGYEIVNTETKQKLITGDVKLTMINKQGQVVTMPENIQAALRPTP
jgi:acyl-CoA thioester hydrolase